MMVKWECADDLCVNICEYAPRMVCVSCGKRRTAEQLYTYEESLRTVKVTAKDALTERINHFLREKRIRLVFEITDPANGSTVITEEDCLVVPKVWASDAERFVMDEAKIAEQGCRYLGTAMNSTEKGYRFLEEETGEKIWLSAEECLRRGFLREFR